MTIAELVEDLGRRHGLHDAVLHDLLNRVTGLEERERKLMADLKDALDARIGAIEGDVATQATDIAAVKTELTTLQQEVADLQAKEGSGTITQDELDRLDALEKQIQENNALLEQLTAPATPAPSTSTGTAPTDTGSTTAAAPTSSGTTSPDGPPAS